MEVWVVTNSQEIPIVVFPSKTLAETFVSINKDSLGISTENIYQAYFSTV